MRQPDLGTGRAVGVAEGQSEKNVGSSAYDTISGWQLAVQLLIRGPLWTTIF